MWWVRVSLKSLRQPSCSRDQRLGDSSTMGQLPKMTCQQLWGGASQSPGGQLCCSSCGRQNQRNGAVPRLSEPRTSNTELFTLLKITAALLLSSQNKKVLNIVFVCVFVLELTLQTRLFWNSQKSTCLCFSQVLGLIFFYCTGLHS